MMDDIPVCADHIQLPVVFKLWPNSLVKEFVFVLVKLLSPIQGWYGNSASANDSRLVQIQPYNADITP